MILLVNYSSFGNPSKAGGGGLIRDSFSELGEGFFLEPLRSLLV